MSIINFESDFRIKLLAVSFKELYIIKSQRDIDFLKQEWFKALKAWHTPYKAIVDCNNLVVENSAALEFGLKSFTKVLKSFFLLKIAGYGYSKTAGHDCLDFEVYSSEEEALKKIAVRSLGSSKNLKGDFRPLIKFDNYHKSQIIELSFLSQINFVDKEQIGILKSKMINNLMLWHSKWNLLIDCSQVEISAVLFDELKFLFRYLRGFFMDKVIGHSPHKKEIIYPMKVFRSRHQAMNFLQKSSVVVNYEDSNCISRIEFKNKK